MSSSETGEEEEVQVVFTAKVSSSSEEPPMEEWSSLLFEIPEDNKKKLLFEEGLYYPGSGEICTKYVAQSDSSVFRHPYYDYPSVVDPGIEEALFQPQQKVIYPDDGQKRYLALCKEMNQCPVRLFHKSLVDEVIDLKYYCVNPNGVRAMALALQYNRTVKVLDLTDNFLNDDACFHLGEMLAVNSALQELILSGCKIGPEGLKRLLNGLIFNRALKTINLNTNELGDVGGEHLAKAIFSGLEIKNLYLRNNSLGRKTCYALVEAFETHNKFVNIDLSWNNLFSPEATYNLLSHLSENDKLQVLNLAWNALSGLRIGQGIRRVLQAPNLKHLDISNNRLSGEAISSFSVGLGNAKKLTTLDLSFNPMTPKDATNVLSQLQKKSCKVLNLLMKNVEVDSDFLMKLEVIKSIKSKANAVIKFGSVKSSYEAKGTDLREIVLNRANFLGMKPKRNKFDIALFAMQLLKEKKEVISTKEFFNIIQRMGVQLDEGLIEEMSNAFPGPTMGKLKNIDIKLLVDYIHRKWPDRKLPPTPPPEPEPEPIPIPKKEKQIKGKKKK